MFLDKVVKRNQALIDAAVSMHKQGLLMPDTYVIDVDATLENARLILEAATSQNIKLYFMLKQIGRNPYLAQKLVAMGYSGAVVVDYKEALVMMEHGIPLGNVGHLVQTPKMLLERMISYGVEVFTVMSFEKLMEINTYAQQVGIKQDVILKVYHDDDMQYKGQEGGIHLDDLPSFLEKSNHLKHISIVGATAFPSFLYSEETGNVETTPNYTTIVRAIEIMKDQGLAIKQVNMPSTTCVSTLKLMGNTPATHGEPGHGLTGTTPMHALKDLEEIPTVIYLSEISHNFKNLSLAYGGGHYRRSHMKHALVVDAKNDTSLTQVMMPDADSIDYYFSLEGNYPVSASVIMAFRFQVFVTRSHVALIEGLGTSNPTLHSVYDSLGRKVSE